MSGRSILLVGDNFGCGSSREHAPWALKAWGFRAVVSSSFADIFRNNALKNGLLPVEVPPEELGRLFAMVDADPDAPITVDLEAQELELPNGSSIGFHIDGFARRMILDGTDELGYLLESRIPDRRLRGRPSAARVHALVGRQASHRHVCWWISRATRSPERTAPSMKPW